MRYMHWEIDGTSSVNDRVACVWWTAVKTTCGSPAITCQSPTALLPLENSLSPSKYVYHQPLRSLFMSYFTHIWAILRDIKTQVYGITYITVIIVKATCGFAVIGRSNDRCRGRQRVSAVWQISTTDSHSVQSSLATISRSCTLSPLTLKLLV